MSTTTLCAATTRHSLARALRQPCRAPRLLVTQPHGLYLNCAARCDYSSPRRTSSTSTTLCSRSLRLVARPLVTRLHRLYCAYVVHPDAPSWRSTSLRLVALALVVRPVTPSRGPLTRRSVAPALLRLCARPGATPCHGARRRLLRLCRTSGCHGTSRGSSSATLPMPHVRVPRHVAWLVVDYFAFTACPGASARCVAHRVARRRLLRLRCASGCLGTLRDSLSTSSPTPCVRAPRHVVRLVVDYFASRSLIVDYFAFAAHPGASAYRAAHRVARHRLLRLCHASGCLSMLRGSMSTSSPTPRVRAPRHVAWLVVDYFASRSLVVDYFASRSLVVDYFAYTVRPGGSACCAARCRLLRLRGASRCLGTSRGSSLLTVKIRQPSHEFTFGVGISFIPYPLVLTPVV
jgi:hypothetical protein